MALRRRHAASSPLHRLLVVAKTKPALRHLSRSFAQRRVRKTYEAMVSGVPSAAHGAHDVRTTAPALSTAHASDPVPEPLTAPFGRSDHSGRPSPGPWGTVDSPLDGQRAVTRWRMRASSPSVRAPGGRVTWLQLRPETGRFHQLRRHAAEVLGAPIVGDTVHDGGGAEAVRMRGHGLFLCSTGLAVPHPLGDAAPRDAVPRPVCRVPRAQPEVSGPGPEDDETGEVGAVAGAQLQGCGEHGDWEGRRVAAGKQEWGDEAQGWEAAVKAGGRQRAPEAAGGALAGFRADGEPQAHAGGHWEWEEEVGTGAGEGTVTMARDPEGTVWVRAQIPPPKKFGTLMRREAHHPRIIGAA